MVTMDALRSFRCCWMDCSCNAISILTTTAFWEPVRDGSCGAGARGSRGPEGGRAARGGWAAGPQAAPNWRWKQATSLPVVPRQPPTPGGPRKSAVSASEMNV